MEEHIISMLYKQLWSDFVDEQSIINIVEQVTNCPYMLIVKKDNKIILLYSNNKAWLSEVNPTDSKSWTIDFILYLYHRPQNIFPIWSFV